MAFCMSSLGALGSSVAIDGQDEKILGELPRQLGLTTPQCDFLWEAFYRSPQLNSSAQVQLFRGEIVQIRAAYLRARKQALQKERNVHAKDPRRLDEILESMLAGDPILTKCNELVQLCDDAIDAGVGILCNSD